MDVNINGFIVRKGYRIFIDDDDDGEAIWYSMEMHTIDIGGAVAVVISMSMVWCYNISPKKLRNFDISQIYTGKIKFKNFEKIQVTYLIY